MEAIAAETIESVRKMVRLGLSSLKSKPPLTAVEWADQYFYLSPESSYVSGSWKTQPVQIAPLNAMGHDDIVEVFWNKSARVGYTKCLLAAALYLIEHKRRNGGIYREDDKAIEKFVQVELDPALRDCKPIAAIFPDLGKKSSGNKTNLKKFIGASLRCLGGQAAGNYRGDSLDFVIGDETNGFVWNVRGKSSLEGDPFTLMFKRTNGSAFPKRILGSTPTRDGQSHIQRLSKRAKVHLNFHFPCPHCGGEQNLEWTSKEATYGLKWTNHDPNTAHYICKHCGEPFHHEDYLDLAHLGRWIDSETGIWTKDGIHYFDANNDKVGTPKSVAFYIWSAYSPTDPWNNLVTRWYEQKDDPITRQGFINTDLGREYSDKTGKSTDHSILYKRRERYQAEVPMNAVYLTSFTDVQADRLECMVKGWGINEESWTITHKIFVGDPRKTAVWDELEKFVRSDFRHESGILMNISRSGIDMGGKYPDEQMDFCLRFLPHQMIPCKGASTYNEPVARYAKTQAGKHRGRWLCLTGTDTAKDTVYSRYEIQPSMSEYTAGYIHLPIAEWCHEEFCKQATNEIKAFVKEGQKTIAKYVKKKEHLNNEVLDCFVGNLAILRVARQNFGLDLTALSASIREYIKKPNSDKSVKRGVKPKKKRAGTVTGGV